MAPEMLLNHIITVLVSLLLCTPRPIQLALASTLPDMRGDILHSGGTVTLPAELFATGATPQDDDSRRCVRSSVANANDDPANVITGSTYNIG